MKLKTRRIIGALLAASVLLSAVTAFGQSSAGRPWTVEDSVSTRYFIDWSGTPGYIAFGSGDNVIVAPDGRHFAIGTHRGDIACDCTRYELLIYSTEQVRKSIASGGGNGLIPLHSIKMASTSGPLDFYGSGIRNVKWIDSDTIIFIGTGELGDRDGVFRFQVKTGKLERLSDPAHNVTTSFGDKFDVKGDTIVYATWESRPQAIDPKSGLPASSNKYPLQPIRGMSNYTGIQPFLLKGSKEGYTGTYLAKGGKVVRTLLSPFGPVGLSSPPHFSPDGKSVLVSVPLERGKPVPAEWKRYEGLEAPISQIESNALDRIRTVAVADTATGKVKTIWGLPMGPSNALSDGFWSPDGKRILLVNVSLPLTEDIENRKQKGYIVDYEVATGKWTILQPTFWDDGSIPAYMQWLKDGSGLLVQRFNLSERKQINDAVFDYTSSGWKCRMLSTTTAPYGPIKTPEPPLEGGLKVSIRESANDPPVAIASDGNKEVTLIEPDSALKEIRRARFIDVQWTERGGHVQHGGLYLPPDGAVKKPYPLVIQFNEYNPNRFWPDGASRAGFAAQALAANGIAVLQVSGVIRNEYLNQFKDENGKPIDNVRVPKGKGWLRNAGMVERVDAAVAELARQGLVDSKRVGLIGFSYTGYIASYVSTHPQKTIPAASMVNDSALSSYTEHTMVRATNEDSRLGNFDRIDNELYGGSFFDRKARELWFEHSPLLNVDKTETPFLLVYTGFAPNIVSETIGAFRLNRKEFDYLFITGDGAHQIHRPLQRQASLQATVDWMSFWLKGEEIDPDKNEARQEQYFYWRKLRKQRDERWAKNGNPYDKQKKPDTTAAAEPAATKTSAEKPDDQ